MLRTSLVARNTLARRTLTASTRRSASSVSEAANEAASKVKDAAESAKNAAASAVAHPKPSSDVPWMIGSLLVFAPVIFYMTSPPSKDAPHAPAPKEKFKPKLRLPDKDSEFYKIPEEVGDRAGEGRPHGEGDHGLRAVAEENDHKVGDQKQGSDKEISANNHDPSSGLKSAGPEKFQAATKMSQQANQIGGGEAARDTKAVTQAAIEARADKDSGRGAKNEDGSAKTGYMSGETPDNAGQKIAEKVTERKAGKTEEQDANDETFHNKDEQT